MRCNQWHHAVAAESKPVHPGMLEGLRIPAMVTIRSDVNVITDFGQSDHRSERSDAGLGLSEAAAPRRGDILRTPRGPD